jgi:hypothetical protein
VPATPELETDTVMVDVPEPPVIVVGEKLTETPVGAVAVSPTLSVKPLIGVTVIMEVADPPLGMSRVDFAEVTLKSGSETVTVDVAKWLIGVDRPEASTLTM